MQTKRKNNRALKAFSLYAIPMSIAGLWPLAENTLFLKIRVGYALLQTVFVGITSIFHILKSYASLSDLMDSITIVAFSVVIIVKVYIQYTFREKLSTVLKSAYTDWLTTEDKKSVIIMKNHLKIVTRIATAFYGFAVPCVALYIGQPFIGGISKEFDNGLNETNYIKTRPCIIPCDYILDDSSEFFYHTMLLYQIIQVFLMTLMNSGTDMMYIAIITHICGQIEILIIQMEEMGKNSDANKDISNLIRRHQHLMNLTNILEDVYNKIIFTQMLLCIFFISIGGVSVLLDLQSGDTMNLAKDILVVEFMLMQSYIYTYPADNLANLGEKMLRGIYNSQWYEMPTSLTKNLVFIMMRLNIPPYLTAGKFFYLTRRSYAVVIKTGASYLSVLRIMIQRF